MKFLRNIFVRAPIKLFIKKKHILIVIPFILLGEIAFIEKAKAIDCEGWVGHPFQSCYPDPISALTPRCEYYFDSYLNEGGSPDKWVFFRLKKNSEGEFSTNCMVMYYNTNLNKWLIISNFSALTKFHACEPPLKKVGHECMLECAYGVATDSESGKKYCKPRKPDDDCEKTGNPVNFVSGHKLESEVDYETQGVNRLHFSRYYNSQNNMQRKNEAGWQPINDAANYFQIERIYGSSLNSPTAAQFNSPMIDVSAQSFEYFDEDSGEFSSFTASVYKPRHKTLGAMNARWRHNFDKALYQNPQILKKVIVYRPNGNDLHFTRVAQSNEYISEASQGASDRLFQYSDHWLYLTSTMDKEYYDLKGRLYKIVSKTAYEQELTYDDKDLLLQVTDTQGRSLSFTYDEHANLMSMTTPEGFEYQYKYAGKALLAEVIYPDADSNPINNPTRQYLYEDFRFPEALTGIVDNGERYATFVYQDNGFAVLTQHAGGADRVRIDYSMPNKRKVTNALGKSTIYHMDSSNSYIQSIEGEPSANCAASMQSYTYDSNNFRTSATDRNGNISTYVRDSSGREISRTEAAGTAEERTIQTEWHPIFNLETKIIEPDRITNFTYDNNGLLLHKTFTENPAP